MAIGTDTGELRRQAEVLAEFHRQGDEEIQTILWFDDPEGKEIRLVDLSTACARAEVDGNCDVMPFYYRPAEEYGLTYWMAVAIIHPSDRGRLRLPDGWGEWSSAEVVWTGAPDS